MKEPTITIEITKSDAIEIIKEWDRIPNKTTPTTLYNYGETGRETVHFPHKYRAIKRLMELIEDRIR